MLSFGKRISILRKELGLSQTDLANQLNTGPDKLSGEEFKLSKGQIKKVFDYIKANFDDKGNRKKK